MMKITISGSPRLRPEGGVTLLELLIVVAIMATVTSIGVLQLGSMRRLNSSAAIPLQLKIQLRLARQQAMSQRRAVTFQYDDLTKQASIIRQPAAGKAVLSLPNFPNATGSVQVSSMTLTGNGVDPSDLVYGLPGSMSSTLGDSTSLTSLPPNKKINITFQPDGSVIDANGNPVNFALFFYNSKAPDLTATAVSVLGSAGRIKTWKYNGNANKYVE
jgi:prepilin-type N-terminal cleavage/methylation domain-containing protein